MNKKIKKIFKIILSIILVVSIPTSLIIINKHLKHEKLFIYKTGINKKAIFNTTWNMSLKEIERTEIGELKKDYDFTMFESGLNNLLDVNRITAKKIENINLWSTNAKLRFEFFDDKLFRYSITGQTLNPEYFDSLTVANLKKRYGEKVNKNFLASKYVNKKEFAIPVPSESLPLFGKENILEGYFLKDSIVIEYKQFNVLNSNKEIEHRYIIEGTYLPTYNEIILIARKEQQSIF